MHFLRCVVFALMLESADENDDFRRRFQERGILNENPSSYVSAEAKLIVLKMLFCDRITRKISFRVRSWPEIPAQ